LIFIRLAYGKQDKTILISSAKSSILGTAKTSFPYSIAGFWLYLSKIPVRMVWVVAKDWKIRLLFGERM